MTEQVIWVAADGTTINLTSGTDGARLLWGRKGVDMPALSLISEEIPLQPGARLRDIRTRARDIDLPLIIKASSAAELRTLLRSLIRRFDPLRGDGKLRVVTEVGDQRQIAARYVGGLEGDQSPENAGVNWRKLLIVVRAHDPYWEDVTPGITNITPSTGTTLVPYQVETWEDRIVEPARSFFGTPFLPFGRLNTKQRTLSVTTLYKPAGQFFPFFPLTLTNTILFASVVATNDGDVEAWPQWTIEGPASDIILTNTTTGERLALLGYTLPEGESIVIDTRPNRKSITRGATNLFPSLSSSSRLWSLGLGDNGISVEMANTGANSRVILRFVQRYLGL